ncbi:MAG: glycosyltransferase family 39 protein [Cyclobacteriaceae bacterium]
MKKSKNQLIIIICASILVLFANLWGYPLYILDEVKNAHCAYEMMESDNLIVPTFNGSLRTDKPPLHYYFMIAAYKLFGYGPFAARFFSAVFGILTICLTFIVSRKYMTERAAKVTAVTLLASIGFAFQFHLATPDAYLVFFIAAALFSFFHFFQTGKKLFLYLSYVAMGLAMMTKGPVGIILPVISIFFFLIAKKKLKRKMLRSLKVWQGALLILVINLPWYLAVYVMTDGEWTDQFFFYHNYGRYTSSEIGHSSAFFLPTLFILAWALPFSAFLIQSLHKPFKYRLNDLAILSLVTFTVTIVFFSLSSNKLIHYVSPTIPFVAVMTGNFLGSVNSGNWKSSKMNWSIYFLIALCIIIPILFYYAFSVSAEFSEYKYYSIIFLSLTAGALFMIYFLKQKSLKGVVISMATSFIFNTNLIFYLLMPQVFSDNPVIASKSIIARADGIGAFRHFNAAFVPATEQKIFDLSDLKELHQFFSDYPEGVVITRARYLDQYDLESSFEVIFEKNDLIDENKTIILSKKP